MPIELPVLPFDRTALEPHISGETLDQHHGRHHRGHVEAVNALLPGSGFGEAPLEDIVRGAQGALQQHAAQAWNLGFLWRCMKPAAAGGGGEPGGALAEAIAQRFGDTGALRKRFASIAEGSFGAGWVWLLQRPDGRLALAHTPNTGSPITGDDTPLLACSLWEHAYYLDYREARGKYLEAFWHVVDWDFVASNLKPVRD